MAIDTPETVPAVSVAPRASGRIERAVHRHEDVIFVRRVQSDARRLIRLVYGGLDAEAMQTAADLQYAATRRARQLGIDPEPTAA